MDSKKVRMRKIYCIKFKMYKQFIKPQKSNIHQEFTL